MSCTIPTPPFDLTLTMNSAPSFPFTLEPESDDDAFTLAGASAWFAIKALPTDIDANALVFASTANGKIAITDAAARELQVDLTADDTAVTATFLPGATYFTYVKIQLATGETRVRSGWTTTLPGGIDAP
jgi:hypothetical protein